MSGDSKLEGDWDKAIVSLSRMGEIVTKAAKLGMLQGGRIIEAALVGHIESQDLGWEDLDPAYKKYKERKNLSNQIWIATSTTMQNITTEKSKDGSEVFVGVKREAPRKDGQDPVLIAWVMEFGSSDGTISARPLFRPTFKEKEAEVQRQIEKQIQKALQKLSVEGWERLGSGGS